MATNVTKNSSIYSEYDPFPSLLAHNRYSVVVGKISDLFHCESTSLSLSVRFTIT